MFMSLCCNLMSSVSVMLSVWMSVVTSWTFVDSLDSSALFSVPVSFVVLLVVVLY